MLEVEVNCVDDHMLWYNGSFDGLVFIMVAAARESVGNYKFGARGVFDTEVVLRDGEVPTDLSRFE